MAGLRFLAIVQLLLFAGCSTPVADDPPAAEASAASSAGTKPIVRLPISDFPELPPQTAAFLTGRGCTIPQAGGIEGKSNVISGDFFEKGRPAWAVLCSRDGRSLVLVFHDPDDRDPAVLGSFGDDTAISPVDREKILAHNADLAGVIDHLGVEIAPGDGASVIRYFAGDQWLELQGAD